MNHTTIVHFPVWIFVDVSSYICYCNTKLKDVNIIDTKWRNKRNKLNNTMHLWVSLNYGEAMHRSRISREQNNTIGYKMSPSLSMHGSR